MSIYILQQRLYSRSILQFPPYQHQQVIRLLLNQGKIKLHAPTLMNKTVTLTCLKFATFKEKLKTIFPLLLLLLSLSSSSSSSSSLAAVESAR
jgi:hypothetical protein